MRHQPLPCGYSGALAVFSLSLDSLSSCLLYDACNKHYTSLDRSSHTVFDMPLHMYSVCLEKFQEHRVFGVIKTGEDTHILVKIPIFFEHLLCSKNTHTLLYTIVTWSRDIPPRALTKFWSLSVCLSWEIPEASQNCHYLIQWLARSMIRK